MWGVDQEPETLGRAPSFAASPWRLAPRPGVPDTLLDAAEVGPLQVRAVSVRGGEHRYHGTVRQDSYALGAADGHVVLAVADGLGSAELSNVGSAAAALAAVSHLQQHDDLTGAVAAAARGLADFFGGLGLEAAQGATTLVLALVATEPADGRHRARLARVGDSTALVLRDGALTDAYAAEDDGPADSTTASLPSSTEPESRDLDLGPGDALLLASDGFHRPALVPANAEHFALRWKAAPGVDSLLTDVNFLARTFDDDRTVAGCWIPC